MAFEISRRNPILKKFRTDLVKALAHEQVLATQVAGCDKATVERNDSIKSIMVTECGGFAGGFSDGDDARSATAFVVETATVSEIEIKYNSSQFQFLAPISAQSENGVLLGNVRASRILPIASDLGSTNLGCMMYVKLKFYDHTHEQFPEESDWDPGIRAFQINFFISDPVGLPDYAIASGICIYNIAKEMEKHGFERHLYGPMDREKRLQRLTLKDLVCMARSVNAIRAREERDAPIEISQAIVHAARYESVGMTRTEEKCPGLPKIKLKLRVHTP